MSNKAPLVAGKLPGSLLQAMIEKYVRPDDSVLIGPEVGADAAALRVESPVIILKSDPITFPTPDIARYLVNVNANDIACMGGRPRWILVTALLPAGDTTPESVEEIFRQLAGACEELGITLVGGHTEITESVRSSVLIGMLVGESSEDSLLDLRRSQPGDRLLLCNSVAIEGTAILASEAPVELLAHVPVEVIERAKHLTEDPGISVVPAATALTEPGTAVRGLHDPTEGGIATAILEVARVSGCDIELSRPIPIRDETAVICEALNLDPLGLIASGALLAVVAPESTSAAIERLDAVGIMVSEIGTLVERRKTEPTVTHADGRPLETFATDELARFFSSL